MSTRQLHIVMGPILMLICCFWLSDSVFPTFVAKAAIGSVIWMLYWWITSPVEYVVTAFLPIAINSVLQITKMSDVINNYASETILLLLGASILTVSWEKTGLDKRIAVVFLSLIGNSFRYQIIFWFTLSMIFSSVLPNAVVCATITPIAVSMLAYIGENDIGRSRIGSKILLVIAYATGVGGLASPLGGAMNLVTVDYLQKISGEEYMYIEWCIRFLPIMVVLFISNILFMLRDVNKDEVLGGSREYFIKQFNSMSKMSFEEKSVLLLFIFATVLSFSRFFYQDIFPELKPAYIFIICAIISFFIIGEDSKRIMVWKSVQSKIIWELLYIFAGGLAAGTLINGSGAAKDIAAYAASMEMTGGFFTVVFIIVFTIILSDITSNTATAAIAMPIIISIIQGIGDNPIPYIYIAAIGDNLSYMLPTSIRGIPVGYGLKPSYMLSEGWKITLMEIILMSICGYIMLMYVPMFSTIK